MTHRGIGRDSGDSSVEVDHTPATERCREAREIDGPLHLERRSITDRNAYVAPTQALGLAHPPGDRLERRSRDNQPIPETPPLGLLGLVGDDGDAGHCAPRS